MTLAKTAARTAALLLCSAAAAQDLQGFQNVYLDVEGTAVLIPLELAMQACALDGVALQELAEARLAQSGLDLAARPDLFTPGGGAGAIPRDADEVADARLAEPEDGDPGTAEVVTLVPTEPNEATEAGNATTAAGNSPTEAGNRPVGASPAASTTGGQPANFGPKTIRVENGQGTVVATGAPPAADPEGTADGAAALPDPELVTLAVCRIDVVRAEELGIPTAAGSLLD